MAQPCKPVRRDVIRAARFTADEWRCVREKADLANLAPCQYLRHAALQHRLNTRVELAAIYHLSRLGNNLNQLARVANTTGRLDDSGRLGQLLAELRAALRRLA